MFIVSIKLMNFDFRPIKKIMCFYPYKKFYFVFSPSLIDKILIFIHIILTYVQGVFFIRYVQGVSIL
jgi:hypothetical protein